MKVDFFSHLTFLFIFLQVETSVYSALLLARLLLNRKDFSWIKRRINFPIKMQASGFASTLSIMHSESYLRYKSSRYSIDGDSESSNKYANNSNIIATQNRFDRTDWKYRNTVLGQLQGGKSTNDCVFTRDGTNCVIPEFITVDNTSYKRSSNRRLNKYRKQSTTASGRTFIVPRRAVLDSKSNILTAKRHSSGWT